MLKVGDRVIHNSYGLCRISAIEKEDAYSGKEDCYVFYIEKTKIIIPTARADMLRYPMKKEDVPEVLKTLNAFQEPPDNIFSGKAIDIYADKVASNNVLEAAGCLRDLSILNKKNALRGSAKNLLESMNKVLIDEISFAQNISKDRAQKLINDRLNKAAGRAKCNKKK